MKSIAITAAAFAAAASAGATASSREIPPPPPGQAAPHDHDHDHDHAPRLPAAYRQGHADDHAHDRGSADVDRAAPIRQAADGVADEIDAVLDRLETLIEGGQAGPDDRRLFAQADAAQTEAEHFRRSVRPGTDEREVDRHFRTVDGQTLGLVQALRSAGDPALRRAAERLAFADERLHAAVVAATGRPGPDFVARQAHVLAAEAERLERAVRVLTAERENHGFGGRHGDPRLAEALHVFAGRVEHFHETAETEHDFGHLVEDFALVDEGWHRVVDLINANPHGAYLSRRAERIGALHDGLAGVLGVRAERRVVRFQVGAVGVDR